MGLAYLLWFFLGTFGAHRFYLKRTGSGWVQFGVHVGGWLLIALALWRVGQGSYVETAQSGAYMMRMSRSAALGGGILARAEGSRVVTRGVGRCSAGWWRDH